MNWLALSFGEVATMWVVASALALLLYLHSRRPLRYRVSTLRFWSDAQGAPLIRRRWLREPWAFLAQIIFLLLIIVALANPHWGQQRESRNVVMVLDTSIWSQTTPHGESPWIDEIHAEAGRFLDSLPSDDRVLLLRTEPDSLPILPSISDRSATKRAVAGVAASSVVPDVSGALDLGEAALAGSRHGLLIYIGPGLLDERQAQQLDEFRRSLADSGNDESRFQFLARLVGDPASIQNRGITGLALRRDTTQPDHWDALAEIKNYSAAQARTVLTLSVGAKTVRQHSLLLAPGEIRTIQDEIVWSEGGFLQAQISPPDALEADDRAAVEIPLSRPVRVAVFAAPSTFADDLNSVLAANPYLSTESLPPGTTPADKPDVVIYAGVAPPVQPTINSIAFVAGSPRGSSRSVRVVNWDSQHPVTRWIRTRDVSVRNPAHLTIQPNDILLASGEGNPPIPLIVAREQNGHKMLILGFDPHNSSLQFESAFPLLMAGSIEWLTQPVEDVLESAWTGQIDLRSAATRIISPSGNGVPFERTESDVRFFASYAGLYRLVEPNREKQIAVNIPALPQQRWIPTSSEGASLEPEPIRSAGIEIWRWLAMLAIIPLWLEWWLFYSGRGIQKVVVKSKSSSNAHTSSKYVEQHWASPDSETHHHHIVN